MTYFPDIKKEGAKSFDNNFRSNELHQGVITQTGVISIGYLRSAPII